MRCFWTQTFRTLRRLVAITFVGGSIALSRAMCYAQVAFDTASDPVYADGWQGVTHNQSGAQLTAGDNGGFGFTPWNFDGAYVLSGTHFMYQHPGFHVIDNGLRAGTHYSNPFNNIGKAWAIGITPSDDGAPHIG